MVKFLEGTGDITYNIIQCLCFNYTNKTNKKWKSVKLKTRK